LPQGNFSARTQALHADASSRILVLDGAMGTMLQAHELREKDFRGTVFTQSKSDLAGNNDVLNLSQPDIVRQIHLDYLRAGADIVKTNTFSSTTIAQADYGLEADASGLNRAGAKLAQEAAAAYEEESGRVGFVAGVLGPTNRTASISPDVNDPGHRNVTFDQLADAYREATVALIEGGADLLLIETVFDTLNAKAAIFAVEEAFATTGSRLPLMISATITDLSGRTLSGQTVEAFAISVRHARPFALGLNCALGPTELDRFVGDLAAVSHAKVSVHPNAGLPNEFGGYDESPEAMAAAIGRWAEDGLVDIVGGCCGTTPAHIRAIANAVADKAPRPDAGAPPGLRLSGLEPFEIAA
jgi:5-methyltetrahydrofolate--homocysteine methyltransferase